MNPSSTNMCTFEITLITRTTESLLFEMISNTYYQDVNPLYNTYHSPAKNNEVKPCMGSGGELFVMQRSRGAACKVQRLRGASTKVQTGWERRM